MLGYRVGYASLASRNQGSSMATVFSVRRKSFVAMCIVLTILVAPVSGPIAINAEADSTILALDALKEFPVKGRAPKTGYSREAFGQAWSDVDRNGCDTRNDILKRDLRSVLFKPRTRDCVVLSGLLSDPYSGTEIPFLRGETTSALVQIDHVVSLSNAWQTGAFQLSAKERTALANDPLNLLAVKGSLNAQKGDGDAATWLPPNKSFRCEYVARQISVKKKYRLWVTVPEKNEMVRLLEKCPGQRAVIG